MRMTQLFRLAAVLLETTILMASVRAGAASLEQEAEAAVQTFLHAAFTRCGTDYFSKRTMFDYFSRRIIPDQPRAYMIEQYHEFTTALTPQPLTPADTQNGIEWQGWLRVNASAKRQFTSSASVGISRPATWTAWQAMLPNVSGLSFLVEKRQGKPWTVGDTFEPREAPDCATIPP
jgi:hypothetical protein